MSFTTNKPAREGLSQTALHLQLARKTASVPAFRPQIVRSIRMHPLLAGGVTALVFVGMIGFALTQKSVYLAISQVYEEPTAAKLLNDPAGAIFDANKYETFLGEQIQMVQRLDVLTAAMNSLPASTYAEYGATAAQAAENIQQQMKVVRVATSYQISISLKGTDPQKTADIVNAITTAYLGAVRKANAAESDQRAQLLGEERQRIESELQAARTEQTALGAIIGVANPAGEGGNPYDAELSGIRTQLIEARAAHDIAAAQLGSLSGGAGSRDGLTAAADELIAGDAGLGSMKATISQRKAQLNEQMSGMTPNNPAYKQDQDQIADLDRTLDRMTNDLRDKAERRLQDKLRTDLQRTGDIEARLNGQLARQIANATSAAPKLQRAAEVAADITRLDTRMAAVDDALRSLRLEVSGPAQVRLSLAATAPERAEANRQKQALLLALPLAILFGIAAAVLMRKQDQHIYGGVDIDDVLGFPPLAVLPARSDVPERVFEEYVLRLAAGIESAYRTSGARTFLLTAVSLTTDIKPLATALTRKFEEIGVNVIVATASEMLMPMGGGPTELVPVVDLATEGFVAANVAKMKTEHGLVLIESEALLNCAQTEYVARCADATILMIECGVTTRQELFRAAELLHRLNVTGIGAVLEEVHLRHADVDFRKAIEALERRQAEPGRPNQRAERRPDRRPAKPRAVVVPEPEPVWEQPVQPAQAAFVHAPEPEPQPVANIAPEVDMLETEGDRVELEYEPAHYHEVLHHVRSTRPTDVDLGWHLPVFEQVPAQSMLAAAAAKSALDNAAMWGVEFEGSREVEAVPSANRRAVENVSLTVPSGGETVPADRAIAAQNLPLREKIAATPTARREELAQGGDASMTRRSSWFDKLLRRDSEAVVSIIPENDHDEAEQLVETPVLVAKSVAQTPVVARGERNEEDYDIPLANRLEQISGTRRGVPPAEPIVLRPSPRLQIVPPEPVESEETATEAAFAPVQAEAPHMADVQWIRPEAAFFEPVQEPVAAEPQPVVASSAPLKRGPRRPLTYHELAAGVERTEAAPVEHVPVAQVEPVAVEHAAIEPEAAPAAAAPFEILGHVSEFAANESATETIPEEWKAAWQEESELRRAAAAAGYEEIEQEFAEPVPVAQRVEEVWAAEVHPQPALEPLHRDEPVEEPEFRFSEPQQPETEPYQTGFPAFEPYRVNQIEADDIEPVYQEASRSLNTGRWDPIPTLRPSGIWRAAPSPVPPSNGHYANGNGKGPVQDGFNSAPPRRWVPEAFVDQEPEALPETVLSRQWGLLSKFQQSRQSSGSYPVAGKEAAGDGRRDADEPGSDAGFGHGNRQS